MKIDDPGSLSLRQRLRFLAKDLVLYGGTAAFNLAFAGQRRRGFPASLQ